MRGVTRFAAPVVFALALAACGEAAAPESALIGQLPAPLHELRLVDEHPQIPAAVFPHQRHVEPTLGGPAVACVDCHHELMDDPAAVPKGCSACHGFSYLAVEIDESKPHTHPPPDL